jgi:EmrB/QacA subfamily drug resistance transporter
MSTFLLNLDNTIVNVALPEIRTQLHPGVSGLQWTVDTYLMVLAALLILSGSLGDRFGRRRVLVTGLVLFACGSLLCGLATGVASLSAFRVVQAVGASMLNPVGLSIVSTVFVERNARARAFGVWSGAVGLGMASGPVAGGILVQTWGWRSVFWASVPLAVAAAVAARAFIPESKSKAYYRPDVAGQALVLLLLTSLVFTIIESPRLGPGSPWIIAGACVFVGSAVAVGVVETRRESPLIDFRFFRSVPFTSSMLIAVLTYAAIGGFLFLNTIYLQSVLGYSPLRAGLYCLPIAVGTVVGAQFAGSLARTRGSRDALVASGIGVAGAGMIAAITVGRGDTPLLLASYLLLGLGFGGANTLVNSTAMAGMPRNRAGVAGAVGSSSKQVGQSLGVAVVGAIGGSAAGATTLGGFVRASHPGWYAMIGIGTAIAALGIVAASRAAQRSARNVSAGFDEPMPETG